MIWGKSTIVRGCIGQGQWLADWVGCGTAAADSGPRVCINTAVGWPLLRIFCLLFTHIFFNSLRSAYEVSSLLGALLCGTHIDRCCTCTSTRQGRVPSITKQGDTPHELSQSEPPRSTAYSPLFRTFSGRQRIPGVFLRPQLVLQQ